MAQSIAERRLTHPADPLDGSELVPLSQDAIGVVSTLTDVVALLAAGTITTAPVWSASGAPAHTPSVATQIYFDTDDGTQYNWFSAAWH